ncbi:MAG: hydrogenase nickel incorporation protein HypB [Parvibaculaceae bacterium]
MCSVCGCSGGARVETDHRHHHHDGGHHHDDDAHRHHHGRLIEIEQNILAKNQLYADENRAAWARRGIFTLNFISSPGAGKTTLLVETIKALKDALPVAVIEGDQETSNDADRIKATGAPAIQINTGKGCHLDAHMVGHAAEHLPLAHDGVMFIENIGNLVCPSGFDLGETKRAVLLSVTEGDDKPMKYPDAFAGADIMVIGKMDLAPYVDFDAGRAAALARETNPGIEILELSARTGAGMKRWLDWIKSGAAAQKGAACTN